MNETEEANLRQAKSQLEASANHLMVLYRRLPLLWLYGLLINIPKIEQK